MKQRIYLDHAAASPVLPAARLAMDEALGQWANPSSPHREGRAARAALERARDRIRKALGWSGELIFTSGASEAAALAFKRCRERGPKPIMSMVEHDSIRRILPGDERIQLDVDGEGIVNQESLALWANLAPGGPVAIQHVNPETGVIQPLGRFAEEVDGAGSYLVVDCAQSAGKMALPPADLAIISAHKFGGPPGIGALLVRDLKLLVPSGGQERGYRPGTENVPAALGFATALEWRMAEAVDSWQRLARLRQELERRIARAGGAIIGSGATRSPYIGSYAMPGLTAAAQLVRFDSLGFAVSAGSACASGSLKPSHVLEAMSLDPAIAANVVRVSFAPETGEEDVAAFADAWAALAGKRASRAA